ncbi:MAG: peroxiredoxin family protein [Chloroflexota bacterium]
MPRPLVPATLVAVALLAVACGVGGASTQPSASVPAASSEADCQTVPEPSSLGAWDPSSQHPTLFPTIISSRQACGRNRILFSFLDAKNQPAATPDRTVSVAFYDLAKDPNQPVSSGKGQFIWAIEGQRGVYVTDATFDHAGLWGAEFTTEAPNSPKQVIRVPFEVQPTTPTVRVGDHAPPTPTPTLASVNGDVGKISTDQHPDADFYTTSVDQALAKHQPFVLAFATPKFCTSAQCGPTLDRLKPVAKAHPGLTFINVEPYKLKEVSGQLQPVLSSDGQLQATDVTRQWGLLTEPWIFVVDRDGVVRGSFESVVGDAELEAALKQAETKG